MTASESRPSFPFYGREFYSSKRIRCLTAAQRGLWMALAWQCWEEGSIPDDPKELELIAAAEGVTEHDVARVLGLCFELREGRWFQAKLEEIRSELDAHRDEKRASGAKGADARWRKHGTAIAPPSDAMANDASASASAPQEKKKTPQSPPQAGGGDSGSASGRRTRPDPVDPDAVLAEPSNADLAPCAAAFRDWARRLGRKFDDAGARALAAKARELGPERFAAAVRHSIASGYVGLVEPTSKSPPGAAAEADPVSNDAAKRERAASTKRVLDVLWLSGKAPRGVVVDADTATWAYLTWQAISSGMDPNDLPQADRDRIREWARKLVEAQRAAGEKPGRAA